MKAKTGGKHVALENIPCPKCGEEDALSLQVEGRANGTAVRTQIGNNRTTYVGVNWHYVGVDKELGENGFTLECSACETWHPGLMKKLEQSPDPAKRARELFEQEQREKSARSALQRQHGLPKAPEETPRR